MAIIYRDEHFDPSVLANASIAFGVFDGFHIGHRYLIAQTIASSAGEGGEGGSGEGGCGEGREGGGELSAVPGVSAASGVEAAEDANCGKSIVLTFDIDPDEVFDPAGLNKLMSNDERLATLAQSGVDHVIVLPFEPELYTLEPDEFLAQVFDGHAPRHMHVGSDFRFGARAAGTVETLQKWGETHGMYVHAHDLVSADGLPVTATRIRSLLEAGDVDEAIKLLGHSL